MYHFKAHTISNKLVSKVFAQKKGGKSYAATNMCYNFVGFRSSPPLNCVCGDYNHIHSCGHVMVSLFVVRGLKELLHSGLA